MANFDGYALMAIFITFIYLLCCTVCWKYWKKHMQHRHIQRSLQRERASSIATLRNNQPCRVQIQANYVAGHPNTVQHVKCSIMTSSPPPGYKDIELYHLPHLDPLQCLTDSDPPSYDDVMISHAQTLCPGRPVQTCQADDQR